MNEWVGRELDGRYLIEHQLGEGGMGVVLRGKHKFTGVPVAIKMLRRGFQVNPDVQKRFLAEAQAPNAIGHPGICKVLDAGLSPDGQFYMVMELLVGSSLREAMTRRELTPEQMKRCVLELLDILGHAHARGMIHRDLKPDNVFLCATGEVKLLDFGIAKAFGADSHTMAGAILGTPAYMAPEQAADARNVDARSDLWAVGVILYEMITGRWPVSGDNPMDMIAALLANRLTPIRAVVPDISRELEALFARALAPDPRMRFGAAAELADALGGLALPPRGGSAVAATAVSHAGSAPAATLASVARSPHPPSAHAVMPVLDTAPGGSKKLLIGSLIGAAVIAIIIGIAATRSDQPAVAIIDAGPNVVDAAVTPDVREIVVDTAFDLRLGDRAACERACDETKKSCGTQLTTCVKDCMTIPGAIGCHERNAVDCAAGATCGYGVLCKGETPRGTMGCGQVAECQASCGLRHGADQAAALACGCTCVAQLAPSYTLQLAQLNACAFRCNLNPGCIQRSCAAQIAACP